MFVNGIVFFVEFYVFSQSFFFLFTNEKKNFFQEFENGKYQVHFFKGLDRV
jgi:hypothetical protein